MFCKLQYKLRHKLNRNVKCGDKILIEIGFVNRREILNEIRA